MKTTKMLVVVLFAGLFSISTNAQTQIRTSPDKTGEKSSPSDTLVFTVYGMDCPGCAGGLEKQVNKIESIQYSKADWVKQELKIVMAHDAVFDVNELENRVKKANFTLEKDPEKKE